VAAAAGYVRRYGPALHVDGGVSSARALDAVPTATGGTLVRAAQAVDGMPVFGGQLVMSLDRDNALVSLSGATTAARSTGAVTVPVDDARRAAVAVAAKAGRVEPGDLHTTDRGLWLYDPALVGVDDPRGVRPVWRFEVSDGLDVRETVLVDAGNGAVALHLDEAPELTRVVCDGHDDASRTQVPACTQPVRTEASGASGEPDVDAAFEHVGETAAFYQEVAGLDLGELIGTGPAGARRLQSWVRWCYGGEDCPMRNASWDGTHMVFGDGYAAADDVVAHELTHGVIDRTSQLFYLHQSGAIN
jgi:Zn-dependent metalloprotease